MATIVRYTDHTAPRNAYPREIISPTHSGSCCGTAMIDLGKPEPVGPWLVRDRRCPACGVTVRCVIRFLVDPTPLAALRRKLEAARLDHVGL